METISLVIMYTLLVVIPLLLAIHLYIAIQWLFKGLAKIGISDDLFGAMGEWK